MKTKEVIRRAKRFSFEKLFRIIRTRVINKEHTTNIPGEERQKIIDDFHILFHKEGGYDCSWLGVRALKYPTDLITYQEIIYETKPDLIIECGTSDGGSAFFMAGVLDLIGKGEIVTIDIYDKNCPKHDRINYLIGKSTSKRITKKIERFIEGKKKRMVILDSDHDKNNVLKELAAYNKFVSEGCYLIVDDTSLGGHPIDKSFGPSPMEAVEEFMKHNDSFEIDRTRERFLLTGNPKGFLKRKTNTSSDASVGIIKCQNDLKGGGKNEEKL